MVGSKSDSTDYVARLKEFFEAVYDFLQKADYSKPQEVGVTLLHCRKKYYWAHQVYTYKNKKKKYPQTCVGEAELACLRLVTSNITYISKGKQTTTKSGRLILFYLEEVHLILLIIQMSGCLWY